MIEIIKDYLISIGMQVDKKSFKEADNQMKQVDQKLEKFSKKAGKGVKSVAKAGIMLAGTVALALGKMASSIAEADRQVGLLAHRLYTTKENARSLQMAMKQMHIASLEELRELAIDPESREQFLELKQLARSLENGEFQKSLKEIRELNHEFRKMMIRFEYLKIEVASHLAGAMKGLSKGIKAILPLIKWIVNLVRGVTILAVNGWKMIFNGIKQLPQTFKGVFNVLNALLKPIIKMFQFIEDLVVYLAGGKSRYEPIYDAIPFLRNIRQNTTGTVTPQQEQIENIQVTHSALKNLKDRGNEKRSYKWGESVGGFRANRIDANGQRSSKDLVLSMGNVLYAKELGQALGDVAGKFRITSGWESGHSANSKHHTGGAMDFGFAGTSLNDQLRLIRAVLNSSNTARAFLEVDAQTKNQIFNQLQSEGYDLANSKLKWINSTSGNHLHTENLPYKEQIWNRTTTAPVINNININSPDPKESAVEVTRELNLLYDKGSIRP